MYNKSFFSGMLVVLLSVFLVSCGENNQASNGNNSGSEENNNLAKYYSDIGEWKVPQPLIHGDRKHHLTRPATELINDKMAVLYSTSKEVILSYNKHETILDKASGSTALFLFTDKQKKNIYALWWKKNKKGLKQLYFRGSSDLGKTFSKMVQVNSSGGVLPTISFNSDGKGNLAIAYYDERLPPYRIYANHSSDDGVTWQAEDTRIDNDDFARMREINGKQVPMPYAINPLFATLDSGKLILVWQQRKIVDGRSHAQFVARISKDSGKTWGKEHTVFTSDADHTVESAIVSDGKRVVVVAAFPKVGLVGFLAADNLASEKLNWTSLGSVEGTTDVNEVSWLKPAISGDKLKVAYIIQKEMGAKYQVAVASMDLDKTQWGGSFRLDRDKNQPVITKASYLDLKALPNGEFVVAWQDSRGFIPMLMLDYTENKGANWQKKAIKLTRGGLSHVRYPKVYVGADKVWLNFEWYITRGGKFPRLSTLQIPFDKTTSQLKAIPAPQGNNFTQAEMEKKLRKRVTQLMDLRVDRKWEETWSFMDPVFQEVTRKDSWLRNIGYITYEEYEIKGLNVEGNFATVDIGMSISLRQQFREGEVMEPTAPKKSQTKTKWLWFYDQWYFYPSNSFTRHLNF